MVLAWRHFLGACKMRYPRVRRSVHAHTTSDDTHMDPHDCHSADAIADAISHTVSHTVAHAMGLANAIAGADEASD